MNNVASEMDHLNKLAKHDPGKRFTKLWENVIHPRWLSHAWEQIRRNKGSETPGADGQTAWDVDLRLIGRLAQELKNFSYRPTPVRRVYIPKANGKTRPLGIPTIKDRLVQQALRMVLEPIFEADFRPCSHGFRQGRSTHTALRDVARWYPSTSWIIEGDIDGFYDNIPHDLLIERVRRRIADERVVSLIRRFLEAGYLEDWKLHATYSGTPQGGILSPLLSNIFAHQLDVFMEETLKANTVQELRQKNARRNPECQRIDNKLWRLRQRLAQTNDKAILEEIVALERQRKGVPYYAREKKHPGKLKYVRYADDTLILVYGTKQDAVEIKQEVARKLAEMGLTLNEKKTKVTHWDEPVKFLGYEIRGTARARGVGIHAWLKIPPEKTRKIREAIEGVCGYHQIPEADLFVQVSLQYQGFCNYFKYATSPQSVFSKLAQETWWAVAHYLARRRKSSIKKMMTHAVRTGHHAKITKGDRTRGTFRQFIGNREVILNTFPPTTREIRSLPNAGDWRADLLPVRPMGWQSGRSLATRLAALDRSNGICERCHANPVDEVHHRVPLRRKRTLIARVESDASQRLTAIALCKQCHVSSHGRNSRPRWVGSG